MGTYRVTDTSTGKQTEIYWGGEAPPTQNDVDRILGNRVVVDQPQESGWLEGMAKIAAHVPYAFGKAGAGIVQAVEEASPRSITIPGAASELGLMAARGLGRITGSEAMQENVRKAEQLRDSLTPDFLKTSVIATAEKGLGMSKTLGEQGVKYFDEKLEGLEPRAPAGSAKSQVFGAMKSVALNIPFIMAGALTRNPRIALMGMATEQGGEQYATMRAAGQSPEQSLAGAMGYGAAEYWTEKIPIGVILNKNTPIGKKILKSMLTDIPGELAATTIESGLIDTATTNPDKTLGEFIQDLKNTAIQTAIASPVMVGVTHPMVKWAEKQEARMVRNNVVNQDYLKMDDATFAQYFTYAAELSKNRPEIKPQVDELKKHLGWRLANPQIRFEVQEAIDLTNEIYAEEGMTPMNPRVNQEIQIAQSYNQSQSRAMADDVAVHKEIEPTASLLTKISEVGNGQEVSSQTEEARVKAEAESLDQRYDGIFMKDGYYQVTDPVTKGTYVVKSGESVEGKLRNLREKFGVPYESPQVIPKQQVRDFEMDDDVVTASQNDMTNAPFGVGSAIRAASEGVIVGAQTEVDRAFDIEKQAKGIGESGKRIYDAFNNTREVLKGKYGNTVRLWRAQGNTKLIQNKHTLNWASKEQAMKHMGHEGENQKLISKDVPIDDIIAVNTGKYGTYEEFIVLNRESKGFIDPTVDTTSSSNLLTQSNSYFSLNYPSQPVYSPAQVDSFIRPIVNKFPNFGNVVVTPTANDFPQEALNRAKVTIKSGDQIFAMYDHLTGTTYINAASVASPEAAMTMLLHEGVGHRGVELFLDIMGDKTRHTIFNMVNSAYRETVMGKEIIKDYKLYSLDKSPIQQMTFAKELIAHMAQTGEKPTLFHRIAAYIRQALRNIGFTITFSDTDIKGLIAKSYQQLNEGAATGTGESSLSTRGVAPTWYSKMAQVLGQKLPGSGTPEQLTQTIQSWANKGEFKSDELKWSGLLTWLKDKNGKVGKQEVLDFVKGNQIEVREVTKGGLDPEEQIRLASLETKYLAGDNSSQILAEINRLGAKKEGKGAKFAQYTLPGGTNYRELLFTLPEKRLDVDRSSYMGEGMTVSSPDTYVSGHWSEPNVLAHVRFNERTDADGNRVLFIEEVQSDWHQEGKKKGYTQPTASQEELDNAYTEYSEALKKYGERTTEAHAAWIKFNEVQMRGQFGVPDAPFSKTWHEFVMKRMLRYAAENGFDKVAWTTGEQQAERYDLSKQIDELKVGHNADGYFIQATAKGTDEFISHAGLTAKSLEDTIGKDIANKAITDLEGKDNGYHTTYSGLDLKVGGQGMAGFYDKMLPDFMNKYGKQWGVKVGETKVDAGTDLMANRSYSGPEWTIQQLEAVARNASATVNTQIREIITGMKNGLEFSDAVSQYGSDTTATYLDGKLSPLPRKSELVHSVDVTPSMKESVLFTGQPMFMRGSTTEVIPNYSQFMSDNWEAMKAQLRAWKPTNLPHAGVVERMLKTPMNIDHPVFQKIVHVFQDLRQEWFHSIGTNIIGEGDNNALDAITKFQKTDKEGYAKLNEVRAAIDRYYVPSPDERKNYNLLMSNLIQKVRDAGVSEEGIKVWQLERAMLDRALQAYMSDMEQQLEKLENDPTIIEDVFGFNERSTDKTGKWDIEKSYNFDKASYYTVGESKSDQYGLPSTPGVTYIMGQRLNGGFGVRQIHFDKSKMDETQAEQWWEANKLQFSKANYDGRADLRNTIRGNIALMGQYRGTYAPRVRLPGKYAVRGYKVNGDGSRVFYRQHVNSTYQATNLMSQLKRDGWKEVAYAEVNKLPEAVYQDLKADALQKAIDRAMNAVEKKGSLTPEFSQMVRQELLGAGADIFKERGYLQSRMQRNKNVLVEGYITDMLESNIRYVSNLAGGLSKAQVARDAMEYLSQIPATGKDAQVHQYARNYMVENLRNMDHVDRIMGMLKTVASMKYLTSIIRTPIVNLTSLLTTAGPAIHQYSGDGQVSITKVQTTLGKSIKDYINHMLKNQMANDMDERFVQEVTKMHFDDPQFMRDAVAMMQSKSQGYVQQALKWGFMGMTLTEQINRGSTLLAGFRIAYEQNLKNGMDENTAYLDAFDRAITATNQAHAKYGVSNKPEITWGTGVGARVGTALYTYTNFSHQYLQLLYNLLVKKGNIKSFLWASLSPLVLGGAAALPFKDDILNMAGALLKLLGYKDDPEKWVWDQMRKGFGPMGEQFGRFGLTGLAGFDISGSLAIGVSMPQKLTDWMGPMGGVLDDVREAINYMSLGHYDRAAEMALPRVGADIMRAYRESKEGITTREHRPVFGDDNRQLRPDFGESLARSLGFRSSRTAVASMRTSEAKRELAAFTETRNDIYERYRAYLLGGKSDPKEMAIIMRKIHEFNLKASTVPGIALIRMSSLRTQARSTMKPSKQMRLLTGA